MDMSELINTLPRPVLDDPRRESAVAPNWELLDGDALLDSRRCEELRRLMEASGDFLLVHDPVWLAGAFAAKDGSSRPTNTVYVSRSADEPIGYAPFTRGSRVLRFAV